MKSIVMSTPDGADCVAFVEDERLQPGSVQLPGGRQTRWTGFCDNCVRREHYRSGFSKSVSKQRSASIGLRERRLLARTSWLAICSDHIREIRVPRPRMFSPFASVPEIIEQNDTLAGRPPDRAPPGFDLSGGDVKAPGVISRSNT